MMDRTQLAELLRVERARRSLSLRDVSEATGVSVSVISELERAKRDVRYDAVKRLFDFFELGKASSA